MAWVGRSPCLGTKSSSTGVKRRGLYRRSPRISGQCRRGKTYEEALANVDIIIQEWIETAKDLAVGTTS